MRQRLIGARGAERPRGRYVRGGRAAPSGAALAGPAVGRPQPRPAHAVGRAQRRPAPGRRRAARSLRTLAAAANSRKSLTWALTIKLTCNNENVKHRECTARIAHDYALAD